MQDKDHERLVVTPEDETLAKEELERLEREARKKELQGLAHLRRYLSSRARRSDG